MIQCDEHIFQMALKPPSLFFNGSFWLPVDWYAASWEDAFGPASLRVADTKTAWTHVKYKKYTLLGTITYLFHGRHFWVDDFPNFPFDGSDVIVPWRVYLRLSISPENQWLEGEISFWNGPFSRDMLIFRGGNILGEYRDVGQEILRAEDWDLLRNPMEQRPSRLSGETQSDYFGNVMCKCWKPP